MMNRRDEMQMPEREDVAMLDHALVYLEQGRPIFPVCSPAMGGHKHWVADKKKSEPCTSPGKVPMVPWRAYQERLPSDDQVRDWWRTWPDANIGMATGALSGIVVLDADGTEARKAVMARGFTPTPAVFTGKEGGAHFWFAHPGREVRNFARKLPGTDFRGDGGYVLLPPSLHASGRRYRWVPGTEAFPLAPLPDWLGELEGGRAEDEREPLDLELVLDGIPEGQRDETIFRFACKLRGDNVPLEYARLTVLQAARLCRPPFDEDAAREKVERAYKTYEAGRGKGTNKLSLRPRVDQSVERKTWKIVSSVDLAKMDLPEPKWAVPGIVPEGVLLVAGKPKFGKSWWVLDLCTAVVTGGAAWGRINVEQGDVLYVTFEDSLRRIQDRQQRVLGHANGISGLDFVTDCPRSDEGGIDHILDWLKEHPRARLVVIDPLEYWRPEENEKKQLYRQDYDSLRPIVEAARSLGISVIVVHHCNKLVSPEDPFDSISGTTGLQGVADAIGVFRKERGMADAVLFLKGKDVDYAELAYKMRVNDAYPAPAFELLGSGEEYRMSRERFDTLEALWREPWQTPALLAEVMDPPISKGAMRKRLFDMAHAGLVRVNDGKYAAGIDRDLYLIRYGHEGTVTAHGSIGNSGNGGNVTAVTAVTSVSDVTAVTANADTAVTATYKEGEYGRIRTNQPDRTGEAAGSGVVGRSAGNGGTAPRSGVGEESGARPPLAGTASGAGTETLPRQPGAQPGPEQGTETPLEGSTRNGVMPPMTQPRACRDCGEPTAGQWAMRCAACNERHRLAGLPNMEDYPE